MNESRSAHSAASGLSGEAGLGRGVGVRRRLEPGEPSRMVPQRTTVIDGDVYTVTDGGIAIHSLISLGRVTSQRF